MQSAPARLFLSNLTHLVLHDTDQYMIYPLGDLDNLTHFAGAFDADIYQYGEQEGAIANLEEWARRLFVQPASLLSEVGERFQMFVLLCSRRRMQQRWGQRWRDGLKEWVRNANKSDPRLYLVPFDHDQNNSERWRDAEARGERSIWDEAADLLREAQSKHPV